ncbi:MAG: sterol desaturase family protein [Rickettsiales bacterium]|nr:sterol desaturase family protein [Rickettsiales bacterium]
MATGLFSIIESIRPAYKMEFNRKELVNDFLYTYLNTVLAPIITFIAIDYFNDTVLTNSPIPQLDTYVSNLPFLIQLIIVLVVMDLAIYVRHRLMHEYLWPFHSIHHSLEQINWVAKFRLHPLESVIGMMFSVFFAYILGLEGQVVAAAAVVIFFFDIFNHANININFPKPICYILSCPNYHKWHHAKEVEAINKNYVVMFPFIDKLFGPFYCRGGGLRLKVVF